MIEKDLTTDIVNATRDAFEQLIQKHPDEHFYAFILYTDSDCFTVLPAANSIEKLEEKLKRLEVSSDESAEFKWISAEWEYEAAYDDKFYPIWKFLEQESLKNKSEEDFAQFKDKVHHCMIEALRSLDDEGFFGDRRNDLILYISSSDDEEFFELENESAKRLNSQEKYLNFMDRFPDFE